MAEDQGERTYGLREAAQRLGVSARSVRRWVVAGQLAASQALGVHGLEYRIAESVLDGHAENMATRATARARPRSATLATGTVSMALEALTTRQATDAAALERAWSRIAELERELATAQARLSAPVPASLSWRERLTGRARGRDA